MNVAAHEEEEKNEKTGKKKAEEEEKNSQLILERLNVGLLWSFRGIHNKKTVFDRGMLGVTGTLRKPTAILTQPK